jgi:hypothetical protein
VPSSLFSFARSFFLDQSCPRSFITTLSPSHTTHTRSFEKHQNRRRRAYAPSCHRCGHGRAWAVVASLTGEREEGEMNRTLSCHIRVGSGVVSCLLLTTTGF